MATLAAIISSGGGYNGPIVLDKSSTETQREEAEKSSIETQHEEAIVLSTEFLKRPIDLSEYNLILRKIRKNKILKNLIFSKLFKLLFERRANEKLNQEKFIERFNIFCKNPSNLEKLETEEEYEFETDRVQDFIVALVGSENCALNSIFESLFKKRRRAIFESASLEAQLEIDCYDQDLDEDFFEHSLENRPAMFIIEETLRNFLGNK